MDVRSFKRNFLGVCKRRRKTEIRLKIFVVFPTMVIAVIVLKSASQSAQHSYTTNLPMENQDAYDKMTTTKSTYGADDKKITFQTNVSHAIEALDALLFRNIIAALDDIRHNVAKTKIRENLKSRRCTVLRESNPEYFNILRSRYSDVRTFFFCESKDIIAQYLAKDYYFGAISDCALYRQFPDDTAECISRPESIETRHSLSNALRKIFFITKPSNTVTESDSVLKHNFTHIHVIMSALITRDGDVIKDDLIIIPNRCGINDTEQNIMYNPKKDAPLYDEVFTIAQYWGYGFFHFIVENIPRIAAHLPFLLHHSDIKVHVQRTSGFTAKFLAELGIASSRLVTGNLQANILYLPAGTPCGHGSIFNTQLLSLRLRAGLSHPFPPRDTIILIRRSTRRWFDNHNDILAMLQKHAVSVGLRTVVYGDSPVLGFKETRELFSRAYIVVAPHGAGESNLIFSQPGTIVVEGLCYDNNGHPNWCYKRLMSVLGHRYYGLLLKKQCMKFTANDVEFIIIYAVRKFRALQRL